MIIPYLDTSALAKWYVSEAFSDEVEEYLRSLPAARISSLTSVEFHCLLARRRRSREISSELESEILGCFQQDIRHDHLRVLPFEDHHFNGAIEIMASLPRFSLRTLDALHLSLVRAAGLEVLATADRVMAGAAEALGVTVERFFPDSNPDKS